VAEKTQPASQRKRDKARSEGQVARSPELLTSGVFLWGLLVATVGGVVIATGAAHWFKGFVVTVLEAGRGKELMPSLTGLLVGKLMGPMLLLGLFFIGSAALATALAASVAGFLPFSLESLAFKPERLNIIEGAQRLFSGRAWVTAGIGMLKLVVTALVFYFVAKGLFPSMAAAPQAGLEAALRIEGAAFLKVGFILGGILFAFALGEAAYARWKSERDLRMSKQEAVEDSKEAEGNPLIKRRHRSQHRKLSRRRMVQAVQASDVVVANPTHFAVAIKYKKGRMRAPKVTAKGADLMAQRMKEVAREHGVPVIEQPPLARALYQNTEVGRDIPANLYRAVARLLTQVYRMKHGGDRGQRR
jgi:flagellar biosynthetic protein FlhB